jgi:hypothetical protein
MRSDVCLEAYCPNLKFGVYSKQAFFSRDRNSTNPEYSRALILSIEPQLPQGESAPREALIYSLRAASNAASCSGLRI